uniref:E3 ubiquitin-protein ligase ZNRF1 n=1 Tax=Strigamia maritima TaxID=126957 RepID=T1JMQ5_STRMM
MAKKRDGLKKRLNVYALIVSCGGVLANSSFINPHQKGRESEDQYIIRIAEARQTCPWTHCKDGITLSGAMGVIIGSCVPSERREPVQIGPHRRPFTCTVYGIKCPVCSKFVLPDDVECHLVMCLTKPRISYNEDILTVDKDAECVICFDDLKQGDTIARLPCLCIYHKSCIDSWFEVNRSCPEHPVG